MAQNNVKGFAYHFLLEVDAGGFPLLEFFLSVVAELSVGTVSESTVTLASWIALSKDICSALSAGAIISTSVHRLGSEFKLNTGTAQQVIVSIVQINIV